MLGIGRRIEALGLALSDALVRKAQTYLEKKDTPNHKTVSLVLVEVSEVIREVTSQESKNGD